jgi:ABC-type transport system involved in multi-copper enzyme maturation permease subunit
MARPVSRTQILLALIVIAAGLFVGSILFILSRAH